MSPLTSRPQCQKPGLVPGTRQDSNGEKGGWVGKDIDMWINAQTGKGPNGQLVERGVLRQEVNFMWQIKT